MSIKRFKDFPSGSGSLSADDIFLFMDSPDNTGVTKKISLAQLTDAIGIVAVSGASADTEDITFSGSIISTANTDQSMTITTNGSANIYIDVEDNIWEFTNTGNLNLPDGQILFPNNTTLAQGTFDNGTGGQSGISLNCYVGYELNWQGGHLKSTTDNGTTSSNILCDSAIEFIGSGIDNVQIDSSGITFSDGTTQTKAGVISNTGSISGSAAINNIVKISQANYDALVSKDSNTIYFIV